MWFTTIDIQFIGFIFFFFSFAQSNAMQLLWVPNKNCCLDFCVYKICIICVLHKCVSLCVSMCVCGSIWWFVVVSKLFSFFLSVSLHFTYRYIYSLWFRDVLFIRWIQYFSSVNWSGCRFFLKSIHDDHRWFDSLMEIAAPNPVSRDSHVFDQQMISQNLVSPIGDVANLSENILTWTYIKMVWFKDA